MKRYGSWLFCLKTVLPLCLIILVLSGCDTNNLLGKLIENVTDEQTSDEQNQTVLEQDDFSQTESVTQTTPEISTSGQSDDYPRLGIFGVSVEAGQDYVLLGDSISWDPKDLAAYPDRVFRVEHTGIYVLATISGLDAEKKVQQGDIIVRANGQEVMAPQELLAIIEGLDGGKELEITFYRGGEIHTVGITLRGKRPSIGITGVSVEAGHCYADLGDRFEIVSEKYAKEHPDIAYIAEHSGIVVKSTIPSLDAANKLQEWDVIVMADGQTIVTINDLIDVINQHNGGDTIEITYYRNGVANIVEITLGYAE